MPVIQTFTASRNATWAPTLNYDYTGPALPLMGAKIAMQLRWFPGHPGEPLLELASIDASDVLFSGVAGSENETRRLTISPVFSPQQFELLPIAAEPGGSMRFAHDILISYADGVSEVLSSGTFILSPGVTTA